MVVSILLVFQKPLSTQLFNFGIGGRAAPRTPLQYCGAASPRPPAIAGGCALRTPCNTGGLRPPDPSQSRGAALPGPPAFLT